MNWKQVQEKWWDGIELLENTPADDRALYEDAALEIYRAAEAEIKQQKNEISYLESDIDSRDDEIADRNNRIENLERELEDWRRGT